MWKEKTRGKGRPELNFHEAEVLNEKLKLLLSETLKSYPGHWVDEMIFSSRPLPFPPLIHNWAKLQELSKERADDKECELARRDLRSLLLEVRRSNECKEYFDSLEQFLKDRVISFECLWTIFPPGTIVLATPYKETQAFVVSDVAYFFPYGVDQNVRRTLRDIDSDDDGEFDNWLALQCWCYGITPPFASFSSISHELA